LRWLVLKCPLNLKDFDVANLHGMLPSASL
jgi:hypothetical protein